MGDDDTWGRTSDGTGSPDPPFVVRGTSTAGDGSEGLRDYRKNESVSRNLSV